MDTRMEYMKEDTDNKRVRAATIAQRAEAAGSQYRKH